MSEAILVETANPRADIHMAWGFLFLSPGRTVKGLDMLKETINQIGPLDDNAMEEARKHHERLAMPLGSLGRLHEFAVRLAGITGIGRPDIKEFGIITMAGDHGIAAKSVSLFPQEVTREMVANFARGGAAINVLSRHVGARLTVVDIGVAGGELDIEIEDDAMVRYENRNIARGTADISEGPAMTREQAIQALEVGIQIFLEEKKRGLDAVGTGDMGIANTTPSSAIASVILGINPEIVVNRGTGIDTAGLENKVKMVARSIKVNRPDADDGLDILSKIGGFEIGGIAGVILAACSNRVPVVVDGYISTAAALLASVFHPNVKDFLFSGHQSAVEGHREMLRALGLKPMIDLGMRLGEGTGAALGLSILSAASKISTEMLTFEEASVSKSDNG